MTARPRGTEALGFIKDPAAQTPIARVRLASDMPAAERPARGSRNPYGLVVESVKVSVFA